MSANKTLKQVKAELKAERDKLPVKVIPYRTSAQSRKYNQALRRAKTWIF